ncbi:18336_t:CDS:1, partial [Gigaspora margarita]
FGGSNKNKENRTLLLVEDKDIIENQNQKVAYLVWVNKKKLVGIVFKVKFNRKTPVVTREINGFNTEKKKSITWKLKIEDLIRLFSLKKNITKQ